MGNPGVPGGERSFDFAQEWAAMAGGGWRSGNDVVAGFGCPHNGIFMLPLKLGEIVVSYLEFLELADDKQLDAHTAVKMLEDVAASLAEATSDEQAAVQDAARTRLAWLLREPDEYGYTPRKTLRPEHRQLLERIAWGEGFGK
jgi:hypothetical protein